MVNEFTIKENDQDVVIKVKIPSANDRKEAQKAYNRAFREALNNGDLLRIKLDEEMRKQGLWNDEKQMEYDTLTRQIIDGEKKLAGGGMKLTDARALALEVKKLRNKLIGLLTIRNSLDNVTVEAQADNTRFNYLVSVCTVYSTSGKPYFKNYNDFVERAESEVVNQASMILMKMLTGYQDDYEQGLPENKFLKKYKFIDEKGRLIRPDGKLINEQGKLVNEEGYFIDEDGKRVDIEGQPVDENGNWIIEEKPFLDEDGNPIVPV